MMFDYLCHTRKNETRLLLELSTNLVEIFRKSTLSKIINYKKHGDGGDGDFADGIIVCLTELSLSDIEIQSKQGYQKNSLCKHKAQMPPRVFFNAKALNKKTVCAYQEYMESFEKNMAFQLLVGVQYLYLN